LNAYGNLVIESIFKVSIDLETALILVVSFFCGVVGGVCAFKVTDAKKSMNRK
jgi:hypothetical protein